MSAKRVGEKLRAATRNGPADRVRGGTEQNGKRGAEWLVEAEEGMSGETGEERASAFVAERKASNSICRRKSDCPKVREQEGMAGEQTHRAKDFGGQVGPVLGERTDESAPRFTVWTQNRFGVLQIALERDGGAIVKGMCERAWRVNPREAVIHQRQLGEEWRAGSEWIDGGAEVVKETGQGELKRACCTAGLRLGFVDVNLKASLSEDDGGGEAVWSGADDGGFGLHFSGRWSGEDLTQKFAETQRAERMGRLVTGEAGVEWAIQGLQVYRWVRARWSGRINREIPGATSGLADASRRPW
jgi:hypothetical protein